MGHALQSYDQDDLDSIALCAWREARGEGEDGLRAVMHVIVNRAIAWYGNHSESAHIAVYSKNQFTSMSCPSDPNFIRQPAPVDELWQYCQRTAPAVANGFDEDLTKGALYYANLRDEHSGWFRREILDQPEKHPLLATIGNHSFFA